jgi:hypothetical protein
MIFLSKKRRYRVPPGEQLRCYGLGIIPYWWHSFHLIDVGHL